MCVISIVLPVLVPSIFWSVTLCSAEKDEVKCAIQSREICNLCAILLTDSSLVVPSANAFVINTGNLSSIRLPRQCSHINMWDGEGRLTVSAGMVAGAWRGYQRQAAQGCATASAVSEGGTDYNSPTK